MSTAAELIFARSLLVLMPLMAASANSLQSQSIATARVDGEVHLMVRPHAGDTLWLQLEQTIDTRSVPAAADHKPGYGPVRDGGPAQSVNMRMFAHSFVESSDQQLTALTTTTDSLNVRTGVAGQLGNSRPMPVAPADRTVRVRVTPDGAMSVSGPRPGTMALDASLQGLPAMLPSKPVSVGEEWEREIALPSAPVFGVRADGLVHAEFRLDSVTRGGRFAYVSMKGTLRRSGAARDLAPGTQLVTAGLLHGFLVLDRTRGWITEAETIIEVQSDITVRPGDKSPVRSLDIRLTQRMSVH